MLSPWSALIVPYRTKRTPSRDQPRGSGAELSSGAPTSSCRRLQKSLRATLGGWDADCPACANQRQAFGSPCSRPFRSGGKAYERIRKHEPVRHAAGHEPRLGRHRHGDQSAARASPRAMPRHSRCRRSSTAPVCPICRRPGAPISATQSEAAAVQPASEVGNAATRCGARYRSQAMTRAEQAEPRGRRGARARRGAEPPLRRRRGACRRDMTAARRGRSDRDGLDQRRRQYRRAGATGQSSKCWRPPTTSAAAEAASATTGRRSRHREHGDEAGQSRQAHTAAPIHTARRCRQASRRRAPSPANTLKVDPAAPKPEIRSDAAERDPRLRLERPAVARIASRRADNEKAARSSCERLSHFCAVARTTCPCRPCRHGRANGRGRCPSSAPRRWPPRW